MFICLFVYFGSKPAAVSLFRMLATDDCLRQQHRLPSLGDGALSAVADNTRSCEVAHFTGELSNLKKRRPNDPRVFSEPN